MELDPETGLAINAQGKYGCTDTAAINYDFSAQIDDSSCVYETPVKTFKTEIVSRMHNEGYTVQLHLDPKLKHEVILFDMVGKQLQRLLVTGNKLLSIPGLQSGIYFVKIKSGQSEFIKKVLIF